MAASATFALKVAVWFRRGRLFMVSPDSLGTACPLSGRNSTYRSVQISETSSDIPLHHLAASTTLALHNAPITVFLPSLKRRLHRKYMPTDSIKITDSKRSLVSTTAA